MSVTSVLPDTALIQKTSAGQPNPGAFFVQAKSDAVIASHIAALGLGPDIFEDVQKLLTLNDPLLVRLGHTIHIAGPKYATLARKSVGWYATIALHNSAIDEKWDGGSEVDPYGDPDTPV